ncbi:MAG: MBL fold metallo-hydrolase [Verrucomicrobiales bacterium]
MKSPRLALLAAPLLILAVAAALTTADAVSVKADRGADGSASLQVEAEPGTFYRLEASDNLSDWRGVVTAEGAGSADHADFAARGKTARYYRAADLGEGGAFTGDHIQTAAGEVIVHPINHASFVLKWGDLYIYNDPVGAASLYAGIPAADLILVGHQHGDHRSNATIDAVRKAGTSIVVPDDVLGRLSTAQQALATALDNGESATLLGIQIDAVPAYNKTAAYHPKGRDNGYVLTIGGTRFYMSGDTEDVDEMRALQNIDVAFLAMNQPFTMTIDQAADAARAFQPKVVYPYHFRNSDNSIANLSRFKELVGSDLGIEVRVRDWY